MAKKRVLIISVRRVRGTLRTVEPLDVTESATDLTLLDLLLGHLLLLLGLELHILIVLHATVVSAVVSAAHSRAGGGAVDATARTAVLEAVKADSGVTAKGNTAVADDNTTLEFANSDGKTTERVSVQEVSRLVKNQKMGVVPHGSGNDDLDLLTTRKRADLVVVCNLRVESEILKMLGNDLGLKLTVTETLSRSLVIIEFLDKLVKSKRCKSLTRDHGVVLGKETTPLTIGY
ncbi:hypothetical protein HG530_002453 [Fusarium avenaceum]|nr:hypothetical protein HG530_002453 [Fusarium avenaceum]